MQKQLNRRRALAILGGTGVVMLGRLSAPQSAVDAAGNCPALAGAQTEGPYWVEENLNRVDIRTDPATGVVSQGLLLNLTINVQNVTGSSCGPLAGANVDIWHCDGGGVYSDEAANNSVGKKFLRGYQISDDNGTVQFTTIYPGWYSGRTVHIHVRVRTYSGATKLDEFVAQLFFDDSVTDSVFSTYAPYNTRRARDTRNSNDMVLTGTHNGSVVYADLTQTTAGFNATATIGVSMKTAAAALPALASGGVVSAASYAAGIAPGSFVAIFGQNLASATRTLASSDIVNGSMPATLAGVGVKINGKPAFPYYVSPAQVNAIAPDDTGSGSVAVALTNAAGTSATTNAVLQTLAPAFFAIGTNVAAVRPDGAILDGSIAAKPGDTIELFGTGFGSTSPAVAAGLVSFNAAPTSNPVTVTIGGSIAPVSFAGLVGPGLYQVNVTVPALANGSYEVVAAVNGVRTQSGLVLKIAAA